eukprot:2174098-Heterocapsa_arctica.AAC.1
MNPQQHPVPQERDVVVDARLAEVVGVAGEPVGFQRAPESLSRPTCQPLVSGHLTHLGGVLVEIRLAVHRGDLPSLRGGSADVDRTAEVGCDE